MTEQEREATQQRIEQLKHEPPRIEYTRREKILRAVGWGCSAVAVVALVISVYATKQAWGTATCVNNILGTRAPSTTTDAAAHIEFADAQKRYASTLTQFASAERDFDASLADVLNAPKGQQAAAYAAFLAKLGTAVKASTANSAASVAYVSAANTYARVLTEDQAQRAAHPLGRC